MIAPAMSGADIAERIRSRPALDAAQPTEDRPSEQQIDATASGG